MNELRPYQRDAVVAALDYLDREESTLLLMATGTGKTRCFLEVIERVGGRALILAHTDKLVFQNAERVEERFGFWPDIEKAESRDSRHSSIVVGSVPTMARPNRLASFRPGEFSIVVVDEVHHAAADSYQRILEHFNGAKKLGVTATAKRMDGKKLGESFDSIAFVYDIGQGIKDGWLAPIRRRVVVVEGLELTGVDVRGGDYVPSQLERRVLEDEATQHAWARGIIDLAVDRKTIAFTPGVESSRRLTEILNRYEPGSAVHLDGESPDQTRRDALRRFRSGEVRRLCNCSLFGEGYDEPSIESVAMCRPTKSQALYVQQIGRGTRINPGKDDLLVLDFTTNTGRHDMVTAVNVLGEADPERVIHIAEEILETEEDLPVDEALEQARNRYQEEVRRLEREAERRREEGMRHGVRARGSFRTFDADRDPLEILGVNVHQVRAIAQRFGAKPISEKQRGVIEKAGLDVPEEAAEARALVNTIIQRYKDNRCSFKQARVLSKSGIRTDVSFQEASQLITALKENRWQPLPESHVFEILGREEEILDEVPF